MEDIVTYDIAKKLKEKGFKDKCIAHYYSNDTTCLLMNYTLADYVQQPFCIESVKISWNSCELNPCSYGCYYDAPTISQVLKWLRGKDIMVEIPPVLCDDGTWTFSFRVQTKEFYDRSMNDYTSYESAALACIEYVLDNLI